MSKLQIGWSEVSITPDKKISLAGQFAERISEYVEKPLTATALAISNDEDQMVMVSVDLGSVGWTLLEGIREKLAGNTVGLDPMKVMVAAIHTHTGPVYTSARRNPSKISWKDLLNTFLPEDKQYVEKVNVSNNPDIASPAEVRELLIDRISQVVLEAWNNRADGGYVNDFDRAVVGHCRRACFSDGSAAMWGDSNTAVFTELESGNDSGIELLYIFNGEKKLTGIVANIACPAQCVEHRLFVSPDYWGEVKMRLRKYFGEDLFLLPLCSPAGCQCPVDLIRWVEPESDVNDPNIYHKNPIKRKADPSMFDLAGMYKTGKRVANAIIENYEEGLDEIVTDTDLTHHVRDVQLPVRRATMTDLKTATRNIKEYVKEVDGNVNYNDVAYMQVNLGVLIRYDEQEYKDILDTEVHTIKLGNIAFGTNPFELFLDYGNQIRARSLAEQTFLVQLCNGAEGYLPTEKAEKGGHYSAFIASGQVGHLGGEQLVRETLKDINGMFRG